MVKGYASTQTTDSLDILSSIWILSCNDENPIITYEGLEYRLAPPSNIDVRQLVQSRGELFRRKVPARRLAKWKQEMLAGKHLPSYIRDIEDEALRRSKIESITPEDVFRNQFRAESNAPRAQIEILDWGLKHIDRMRSAKSEAREENLKKWGGKWLPLLSTVLALVTVLTTAYFQNRSLDAQTRIQMLSYDQQAKLKYYEVELQPKQANYDRFMESLIQAGDDAQDKNHKALADDLTKMELAYYKLERFLQENNRENAELIWNKLQGFSAMCFQQEEQSGSSEEFLKSYTVYKKDFRRLLTLTLFPDSYR